MAQRNGTPPLWMLYLSAVYAGVLGFLIVVLGDPKRPSWSELFALRDAREVLGLGTILGLRRVHDDGDTMDSSEPNGAWSDGKHGSATR